MTTTHPVPPTLSQEEIFRYTRHLIIPDVGLEGQIKLKAASVLVVGAGGLGSPICLYLAAAGVGHIGVVDYDAVDSSNLQRQVLHDTAHIAFPKAESARQRMLAINPHIQVDAIVDPFTSENAREISSEYDILMDGTDNFPTRYLLNDLAVLTGKPYIYGSIYRFEGQVSVFDARRGPCYRCLFSDPPPPGSAPSCAEGGVIGVLPGVIGVLQATEAVKLILGIGEPLIGSLLLYDALDVTFQRIHLRKNPACKVCSPTPQVTDLIDYEEYCGVPLDNQVYTVPYPQLEIAPLDLAEQMKSANPPLLVDVREAVELQVSRIPGALNIPMAQLERRVTEIDPQRPAVFFCRTGIRSMRALRVLLGKGYNQVFSLRGGINAWVRQVDPSQLQY